jgi:hypothetical protein
MAIIAAKAAPATEPPAAATAQLELNPLGAEDQANRIPSNKLLGAMKNIQMNIEPKKLCPLFFAIPKANIQ